jgi:hypothetical protein
VWVRWWLRTQGACRGGVVRPHTGGFTAQQGWLPTIFSGEAVPAPRCRRRASRVVGAFEASFTKPLRGACMRAKESRPNEPWGSSADGLVAQNFDPPVAIVAALLLRLLARIQERVVRLSQLRASAHDVRTLSVRARPPPKVSSAPWLTVSQLP